MELTSTITVLELVWTLIAGIGLIFVGGLLGRSWGDLMFINHAKVNGLRKYSAVTSMLIFIAACVTQLSYLSTGVIAMTQKSSHDHPTAASISIAGIVIFSSISSTVFAGLIYYRRIKLIDIIKESGSLK